MVFQVEVSVVVAESCHGEWCYHQKHDETCVKQISLALSLDPGASEDVDKSVGDDDQNDQDIPEGGEEWDQEEPHR